MMSNWRLWTLPLCSVDGGPTVPANDSRLLAKTLVGPAFGKAAMDSRRLLPKSVDGTREIVTTECLRPPGLGAGAVERVAKNAASRADGAPLSDKRRT